MSPSDEKTDDLDSAWDDDEDDETSDDDLDAGWGDDEEGEKTAAAETSSEDLDAGWGDDEEPAAPAPAPGGQPASPPARRYPHRERKKKQARASARPKGPVVQLPQQMSKKERRDLERRGRAHASKRHRELRAQEKAERREAAKQAQVEREDERRKALKVRAKAEKKRRREAQERKREQAAAAPVARKKTTEPRPALATQRVAAQRMVWGLSIPQLVIIVVALTGLVAFTVWRLTGK